MIQSLGGIAENMHKTFIDNYIQRLLSALSDKILKAKPVDIKNFKKEQIEELVNTMWDRLMARLLP